jgi:ribosome-binding factor A
MDQINEMLRAELSLLMSRESPIPNGLITITRVKCSPDLKNATILISVLPENVSGTALSKVRAQNSYYNNNLRKKLSIKFIPKLTWKIDSQERYAASIDRVLDEIHLEPKIDND